MKFVDAILHFKSNEDPIGVAMVIGDTDAIKLLSFWPRFSYFHWEPAGPPPEDGGENALWEWLWSGFTCDWQRLAAQCGLDERMVEDKFRLLVSARLVYPDGTISGPGRQAVNAYVASHLPKKKPPKKKAEKK